VIISSSVPFSVSGVESVERPDNTGRLMGSARHGPGIVVLFWCVHSTPILVGRLRTLLPRQREPVV